MYKNPSKSSAHGNERTRRQLVDNGRAEYLRRERYCIAHGWLDVLAAGGDDAWQQRHAQCRTSSFFDQAIEPEQTT